MDDKMKYNSNDSNYLTVFLLSISCRGTCKDRKTHAERNTWKNCKMQTKTVKHKYIYIFKLLTFICVSEQLFNV